MRIRENRKGKNRGTTMVEVMAGFTLLAMLFASVMNLVRLSSGILMKSKDILTDQQLLREELCKKEPSLTKNLNSLPGPGTIPRITMYPCDAEGNRMNNGVEIDIRDVRAYSVYNGADAKTVVYHLRKE